MISNNLNVSTEEKTEPVKLIREQIIENMLADGMTMDQINRGTFYDWEFTGVSIEDEENTGLIIQSTKFGTREHFKALQNMIRVYENSDLPPFRMMAKFMIPRDADGNPITSREVYQKTINRNK